MQTSKKKLTRYGSDLILAHTVHRNSISSFSVGAAFTSPQDFISLYNQEIKLVKQIFLMLKKYNKVKGMKKKFTNTYAHAKR